MRTPSTILAAAVIAGSALLTAPAGAAPLSGSLALKNSTAAPVETVQFRRGNWRGNHSRGGNWIGPAVGFAAGAAIGSALAAPYYYGEGYDSYGYAPAYRYRAPRYYGDDPLDRFHDPARGED
jgi:hypothetical protein